MTEQACQSIAARKGSGTPAGLSFGTVFEQPARTKQSTSAIPKVFTTLLTPDLTPTDVTVILLLEETQKHLGLVFESELIRPFEPHCTCLTGGIFQVPSRIEGGVCDGQYKSYMVSDQNLHALA